MKILDKIIGKKEKGTPCWLLSKEGGKVTMCRGTILVNHKDAVLIDYIFTDETGHSLVAHQDDYLCLNSVDGRMIYTHNVGDLFSCNCRFDGQIGSEYFHEILESDVGSNMLRTLRDFQEGSSLPWKTIIIVVGIAVAVIFLWKTGMLNNIIEAIKGTLNQGSIPPTPVETIPLPPVKIIP